MKIRLQKGLSGRQSPSAWASLRLLGGGPARRVFSLRRWTVWGVVAIAGLGCPSSNPSKTSLEPSSTQVVGPTAAQLDKQRYAGTFAYVGSSSERAAVEEAVDAATSGMLGMNIARHELMKRSEIRPTYTISFDDKGNVSVETLGYPPEVSPLDGTEVKLTDKYGDVVQNSQRFVDGALLQQGRTNDGNGSTQFKLQPDGKTMRVTRVSKSPKLPKPVEFRLTYVRRQSP